MITSTDTTPGKQSLSRGGVIEELRALLKDRSATPGQDIFEQGEQIGVTVRVWNTQAVDTCDVTVMVYGLHGQPTEVEGVPIILFGETDSGILVMRVGTVKSRGTDRGDVSFLDVPDISRCNMRIPIRVGQTHEAIDFLTRRAAVSRVYAASHDEPTTVQRPSNTAMRIDDNHMTVTVGQTPRGTTAVSFATELEELGGAVMTFAFVSEAGMVEKSDTVILNPVDGEEGLWEGLWEETLATTVPCKLVYEILPVEENHDTL